MNGRVSPVVFMTVYCVLYVVLLAFDLPLFRYYPLHGNLSWGAARLQGVGPAIVWYGLVAGALIPALIAGLVIRDQPLMRRAGLWPWLIPAFAMAGCAYLMRIFFMR